MDVGFRILRAILGPAPSKVSTFENIIIIVKIQQSVKIRVSWVTDFLNIVSSLGFGLIQCPEGRENGYNQLGSEKEVRFFFEKLISNLRSDFGSGPSGGS